MYAYYNGNSRLHSDDILAIQSLYGFKTPPNTTTTTTVPSRTVYKSTLTTTVHTPYTQPPLPYKPEIKPQLRICDVNPS